VTANTSNIANTVGMRADTKKAVLLMQRYKILCNAAYTKNSAD